MNTEPKNEEKILLSNEIITLSDDSLNTIKGGTEELFGAYNFLLELTGKG
jgi:hypothetical protein